AGARRSGADRGPAAAARRRRRGLRGPARRRRGAAAAARGARRRARRAPPVRGGRADAAPDLRRARRRVGGGGRAPAGGGRVKDLRDTLVIARRELLERVRSKWFAIATLIGPIGIIAMIVIPALLASRGTEGTK